MTDTITQVISSGTSDRIEQVVKSVVQHHDKLDHRDYPDQHPISAITGLQNTLDSKQDALVQGTGISIDDTTNTISNSGVRSVSTGITF